MADDWKPGDLALCVRSGRWSGGVSQGPQSGAVHSVTAVDVNPENSLVYLGLADFECDDRFASWAFRKIHPHTPDEQDEETIRLLNLVEA